MGEVIQFGEKDDRIWVCGYCGCDAFHLHEDTTASCASCGYRDNAGRWHSELKPDGKPDEGPTRHIDRAGSVDLARAKLRKDAMDPGAVAIIVLFSDGRIHAWNGCLDQQTDERKTWFRERTETAISLLNGEPDPHV